MKLKIFENI